MKAGDRIRVVKDDYALEGNTENLIGYVGVITLVWPDGHFRIDLDEWQDEDTLTDLYFANDEVEPE